MYKYCSISDCFIKETREINYFRSKNKLLLCTYLLILISALLNNHFQLTTIYAQCSSENTYLRKNEDTSLHKIKNSFIYL